MPNAFEALEGFRVPPRSSGSGGADFCIVQRHCREKDSAAVKEKILCRRSRTRESRTVAGRKCRAASRPSSRARVSNVVLVVWSVNVPQRIGEPLLRDGEAVHREDHLLPSYALSNSRTLWPSFSDPRVQRILPIWTEACEATLETNFSVCAPSVDLHVRNSLVDRRTGEKYIAAQAAQSTRLVLSPLGLDWCRYTKATRSSSGSAVNMNVSRCFVPGLAQRREIQLPAGKLQFTSRPAIDVNCRRSELRYSTVIAIRRPLQFSGIVIRARTSRGDIAKPPIAQARMRDRPSGNPSACNRECRASNQEP